MRKNFLSLLLTLSLVLGCMPMTALAAELEPRDENIPAAEDNTADTDEPSPAAEETPVANGEDETPPATEESPTADEPEQASDVEVPADGGTGRIADFTTLTGTWGGIQWVLTPEGELTIYAAPGAEDAGVMPSGQVQARQAPWLQYLKTVSLTTLHIQEGVTHIGDYIFCNDTEDRYPALTTVTLPNSLTSIGKYAFYTPYNSGRTSTLKSIALPPNLSYLGEKAFYGCTELTGTITIPGSCKVVSNSAFSYTSISELNLSEGVEEIGVSAFANCTNLSGVLTLPSSITNVYQWAFTNCGVESVFIDTTKEGITFGPQVFESCKKLKRAIIDEPNNVTELPYAMFKWCEVLESVSLPMGLKSIGYSAFTGCSALTEIELPDSLLTIEGYAFSSCTSLQSITIPNKVREVKEGTFYNCPALDTVVFGEQVRTIDRWVFDNTSPKNITLYYNLTSVYNSNFKGLLPMNVTFYGTEAEWATLCSLTEDNNRLTDAKPTIIPVIHTKMMWNNDADTNVSVVEASQQQIPLELTVERPVVEGVTAATPVSAMAAVYDGTGRMLELFSCKVDQSGSVMNIRLPANAAYLQIIMVDDNTIAPLLPAKHIT